MVRISSLLRLYSIGELYSGRLRHSRDAPAGVCPARGHRHTSGIEPDSSASERADARSDASREEAEPDTVLDALGCTWFAEIGDVRTCRRAEHKPAGESGGDPVQGAPHSGFSGNSLHCIPPHGRLWPLRSNSVRRLTSMDCTVPASRSPFFFSTVTGWRTVERADHRSAATVCCAEPASLCRRRW